MVSKEATKNPRSKEVKTDTPTEFELGDMAAHIKLRRNEREVIEGRRERLLRVEREQEQRQRTERDQNEMEMESQRKMCHRACDYIMSQEKRKDRMTNIFSQI